MPADAKLETLERQLSTQSFGPLDPLFDQVLSMLTTAVLKLAASLEQAVLDQPLTTLLLACQAGYVVARVGRRYARR
jgi:hypothetical protein